MEAVAIAEVVVEKDWTDIRVDDPILFPQDHYLAREIQAGDARAMDSRYRKVAPCSYAHSDIDSQLGLAEALNEALEKLGAEERMLIEARFGFGRFEYTPLPVEDIAQASGQSVALVEFKLAMALARLREKDVIESLHDYVI